MRHALLVTSVLIGLAACSNDTPPADTAPAPATPASTPTAAAHAFSPEVTAADYAEFTRVLASDELEGRRPHCQGFATDLGVVADVDWKAGMEQEVLQAAGVGELLRE